jgi:hypothetical protein
VADTEIGAVRYTKWHWRHGPDHSIARSIAPADGLSVILLTRWLTLKLERYEK